MRTTQAYHPENAWLESLKWNPLPTLLDAAPLPVRYAVFKDVLGDTGSDDFIALQKNLRKHQPRRRLFNEQDANGLWPLVGKTSSLNANQRLTLQLLRQLEALHELVDYAVTARQEKALLGMREVIRLLAENTFDLRLHHNSQVIYLAISFGLEGNPIIKDLIRSLLNQQLKGGGWSSLPKEDIPCLWSSMFFLWVMGHSEKFRSHRSLKAGVQYVRGHLLVPDGSRLLPGMQPWDTLISGTTGLSVLGGGMLRYLEIERLYDVTGRDRGIEKRLDWLMDQQLKSTLWPAIVGRDKQGDHRVTLRVLLVLKHFETLRVMETRAFEADDE